MIRTVVNSLAAMKKVLGGQGNRTYRKVGRSHPISHRSRRQVHLEVSQLESRVTPSATLAATSFFDSAIYEFDSGTGALKATLVAPNSSPLLQGPAGLTVGPDGNLYVSSQFSDAIVKYDLTANTLSNFIPASVLHPIATANGDSVFAPAGLRFGADGNLYVSLNGGQSSGPTGGVVRFNINATPGGLAFSGTSATIATGLIQPSGLAFGTATGDTNNLYVSNSGASDVVKLTNASGAAPTSTTFVAAQTGVFPAGLNWGSDGKLYVVDLGAFPPTNQGSVLQFNADGSFSKIVTPTTGTAQQGNLQNQFPSDVLFDGQGHLLTGNLGQGFPPTLLGSINQYNVDGSFAKILVSSSQFPNTGQGTSGIAISQLALLPVPVPTTHFVVSNLSPTSVTAGGSVTFTVSAENSTGTVLPGYTGTVQLTSSDSQAGLPPAYTFLAADAGSHTFTVTLGTAGNQTVTVTDQNNLSLPVTTSPIAVTAGALNKFVVSAVGGNTVTAGNPFIVTVQAADQFGNPVSNFTGPATFTTNDPQVAALPGATVTNGFGVTLGTLKTVAGGPWTITAAAGTMKGTSSPITVNPTSAVYFTVAAPPAGLTGTPVNITVKAFDQFQNLATGYAGKVHLTSSDAKATLPADATLTGGIGSLPATLNTAGSQTITATDALSASPITITGASAAVVTSGLMVTALTNTPTGFTVAFNKALNPADLTIFGGAGTVQDVLLVGKTSNSSQPYPGTLIVDASKKLVTFNVSANFLVASNPGGSATLPDDTYTVTLISGTGSNGFQDQAGQGIDNGLGGHADYVGTFATTFQHDKTQVLGIVDFARGPNASGNTTTFVKVPNDPTNGGHVGIPITIYNAANLTSAGFTLTYNANILTVTGGISDPSNAAATFKMTSNILGADGIHSVATFAFTSATPQSGTQILGDITAYVPYSARSQYQVKDLLALGAITVNSGATVVPASAVDVNAYFGDVNGDHHLDALDKGLIANVASTASTGFSAFTLLDPAIIGDLSGDNAVTSNSTSLLSNYLLALPVAKIPALPNPAIADSLFTSPFAFDPTLSLPVSAQATSQGTINVPVLLDHPRPEGSTGLIEAELALTYDPAVLTVSAADITLGSIPSQGTGWQLSAVVDAATGQIGIQLFSPTAITSAQAGSLVNIAFHVALGAAVPATAVQLVEGVTPHGQSFGTLLADAQAAMILSPGLNHVEVPTGIAPISAVSVSTNNAVTASATNGQTTADIAQTRDSQDAASAISLLTSFDEGEAAAFAILSNGATVDEAVHTMPANLIVTGALAFQTNATAQPMEQVTKISSSFRINDFLSRVNADEVVDRLFQIMAQETDAPADSIPVSLPQDSFDSYFEGLASETDALVGLSVS